MSLLAQIQKRFLKHGRESIRVIDELTINHSQAKRVFMFSTSFIVTDEPENIISFIDFQIDQATTC